MIFIDISYTWEVIVCIWTSKYAKKKKEILRSSSLSPSQFCLWFDFEARKKKSPMCCLVKYRFVRVRICWREKKLEKREKNERIRERKKKTFRRRRNTIFCCWNTKSSSGQFISSLFSFIVVVIRFYACLPLLQRYFTPIAWTLMMMIEQMHVQIE